MHFDMAPFAPISGANPLLRFVSVGWLHVFCIASGLVGAVVLISLFLAIKLSTSGTEARR
jgi:hypothetical protein